MTYEEVMAKLEELGNEQTKKIFKNHGAVEPIYGVKVGDLKKHLVKKVKKDQDLALKLYDSGNSDAMYLAGLSVDPKQMTKQKLQQWVEQANWYMLSEYTVAQVAAESPYALELAREWMSSDSEMVATAGWSTYSNYLSITPDDLIDGNEVKKRLKKVEHSIHEERNRVRYVMNGFVISVGAYYPPLTEEAKRIAEVIGKVKVNMGKTACKVPLATEYIEKIESREVIGKKRKTCIC
ncbi:DNA alkylation repair protein [Chengkuizengella axinellae]|uniref:DNA alkylation repair protein n=1 Tax=Chengkuizengella axinellae TaxID=3064388 RepID=A0ABT9J343_9BACL|nr:DNA alkylation repair protein [Chengkuizengella sp. 2205SS18-9]MDP5276034.1 DNA alkylation repair protein [Chengkuizengella sp. 2205SS18-9]